MLNMMVRTHLPVAYFCCGRKVSDDLEVGSVKKIFDLLFQTTDGDRRFLNNPAAPLAGDLGGASDQSADRPYFIANRNSDVFHTMDCKWSHKIKSENIVHFSNPGEAAAQQFLPCRSCHPDQADSSHTGAAHTADQTLTNYR
jgi:hypothetical protein